MNYRLGDNARVSGADIITVVFGPIRVMHMAYYSYILLAGVQHISITLYSPLFTIKN